MARKSKKEAEAVEPEKNEKESSVDKRKRAVKQKKVSRFSGLILLVITVLVGFLFWVSGEVRDNEDRQVDREIYQKGEEGVIIIE